MALHPVQITSQGRSAKLDELVTLRAYEVYCHVYAPQPAMVTDGCRGGFSTGEIIAFLYAHSFPQDQWKARVNEAMRGMENL